MNKYSDTQARELTQKFFLHLLRSPCTIESHFDSSSKVIDFSYLKDLSAQHNILPSVAKLISGLPDNFTTVTQKAEFQEDSRSHVMCSLQMAREYTRISELLTSAEIAHIPYKGPVLAEQYYPDPPLRTCSDLDIIVPKEQSVESLTLLADHGFTPAFGLDRQRWAGLPSVTNHFMMLHPTMGWGVEIHWELFKGWQQVPFDLNPYWRKAALVKGGSATQLSDEDMLVISCAHALKHSWSQMKWVMDLDRIIQSRPNLDWQKVVVQATSLGLLRGLGTGLLLADQCFATPLPELLAKQLKADKRLTGLVMDVTTQWSAPDSETISYAWKVRFFLRSRERFRDKVLMCFRYLFSPTLEDYLTWNFGRRVCLYRLLRPIAAIGRLFGIQPKMPYIKS